MVQHKLVVLTNPVEGQEAEFESWYDGQHLGDFLRIPGFVGAQRFRILPGPEGMAPFSSMAIYDIDGDPAAALGAMMERVGGPDMPMSPAFNPELQTYLVQAVGPKRTA